ncbi:hypothetical protein J6590_091945, partial [Homalodisca vitripennis]
RPSAGRNREWTLTKRTHRLKVPFQVEDIFQILEESGSNSKSGTLEVAEASNPNLYSLESRII